MAALSHLGGGQLLLESHDVVVGADVVAQGGVDRGKRGLTVLLSESSRRVFVSIPEVILIAWLAQAFGFERLR